MGGSKRTRRAHSWMLCVCVCDVPLAAKEYTTLFQHSHKHFLHKRLHYTQKNRVTSNETEFVYDMVSDMYVNVCSDMLFGSRKT